MERRPVQQRLEELHERSELDCPRLNSTVDMIRLEPGGLSSAYEGL
ncbi:hypothetical protein SAMN05421858_5026 [Haladaptatus litoreus]|uniref:Uncharacterized protein n=1 Tax=Haladaptatus litoreus TaxID=553468 RepID=A0A1N7FF41_9EURY|nr:hypothetical protein SAMN05421858_5026 [Haladaptatus litoreus]